VAWSRWNGRLTGGLAALRTYGPALAAPLAKPARRFVILTTGRTGSELLVSLLDSHPRITCDGELFAAHLRLPRLYVAARAASAGLHGAHAYGWKLLARDFRATQGVGPPDEYVGRLQADGYRVVLLERRDVLQQTISSIRAGKAGYHHRGAGAPKFEVGPMDPVEVLVGIALVEESNAYVRKLAGEVPHLRLCYEDDLLEPANQQATVDRVCEFLELPSARAHSELVKVTPRQTRDLASNYDEIADLLAQTRFASHLP
jgi:LPS sulfotransferase NodH